MSTPTMTTEQHFNRHAHGLWQALQDFAKEQNVTLTPKDDSVTVSMKKVLEDVTIGKVSVSGDNAVHFSYTTSWGAPACFNWHSPRTGVEACMRAVRRHTEEASQPPRGTFSSEFIPTELLL